MKIDPVIRSTLLYVLLAAGSAVFILPFLYMVGTSFKMDSEMSEGGMRLLPHRPVPAAVSPYLDTHLYPEPKDRDYGRTEGLILWAAAHGSGDPPDEMRPLVPGIFQRLRQSTPASVWKLDEAGLAREIAARVTPELVREVRRNLARELKIGSVRVRGFDLQEQELAGGQPPSDFWKIEGPGARLDDLPGEGRLAYDFRPEGCQEVRLSHVLDLPFSADRLWRVQIALTPDDSWHALEFQLEKNGRVWKSARVQHLGGTQPLVVTLQDRGPDDNADSTKLKLWISMDPTDLTDRPDPISASQARLTLVLHESTQARAWGLKIKRNYERTFAFVPFWRYVGTSVFLVILNIIGTLFSCSLAAYAFSRLQWPGRNLSFGLMMATMMIPPQVTMIPYFLIIKHLGWFNTLQPLWVMSFFGNAFNIFLLRQFMKGIPRDLEDAAKIDGCNFLQIYWHVILPLVKPTLACIAVFTFMAVWNDFMGPLLFLSDQRLYPISLGLYALNAQEGGNTGMMMAGSLLMTLPVIVLFFFAQRYFIQGVTLSGMKG